METRYVGAEKPLNMQNSSYERLEFDTCTNYTCSHTNSRNANTTLNTSPIQKVSLCLALFLFLLLALTFKLVNITQIIHVLWFWIIFGKDAFYYFHETLFLFYQTCFKLFFSWLSEIQSVTLECLAFYLLLCDLILVRCYWSGNNSCKVHFLGTQMLQGHFRPRDEHYECQCAISINKMQKV